MGVGVGVELLDEDEHPCKRSEAGTAPAISVRAFRRVMPNSAARSRAGPTSWSSAGLAIVGAQLTKASRFMMISVRSARKWVLDLRRHEWGRQAMPKEQRSFRSPNSSRRALSDAEGKDVERSHSFSRMETLNRVQKRRCKSNCNLRMSSCVPKIIPYWGLLTSLFGWPRFV